MTTLDLNLTVGQLVAERPGRARVFERLGIDYCCGGRVPFARACATKGLDAESVLRELKACDTQAGSAANDEWLPSSMAELADSIVATHHAYLRRELPRLSELAGKVADAHGEGRPELRELRDVFSAFRESLEAHTDEEERVVFPGIKRLEAGMSRGEFTPGDVSDAIRALEQEHHDAGAALARMPAAELGDDVRGRDERGAFWREGYLRCARFGIQGLTVPEEFGGKGLDLPTAVAAMEGLGFGCPDTGLVFAINASLWTVTMPILAFGTEQQKRRWLPGLCDGTLFGANAASEPGAGSDIFGMQTRADRRGDGWVLDGRKTWITGGIRRRWSWAGRRSGW